MKGSLVMVAPEDRTGVGRGSSGRVRRGNEALDAIGTGLERVLAQDRPLPLVVELQVHPVDRVVTLALLGLLDEGAAEAGARRLRRLVHRELDLLVGDDAIDLAASLQQVV